jgi:type I restriction enzyme S subunit
MSSNTTNIAATQGEARPARVPKLRFPEFRGSEGWQSKPLKDSLSSISNGLALEQRSGTSGYRVTRIETISDGTIDLAKVGLIQTPENISTYRLRVGDILLSNINSVAHIGKSVFVDRDYDLYHGMNLLRLEVNRNQHDPKFIFYAINTDWIRASLRERANKAVNQASINQTELGKTEVFLPLKPEQQKIAECLSSLDALMAAQARKVDLLKTHKKGLMQQLFPREGETQPRLRFPEFRDAGGWKKDTLGSLCARIMDGTHFSPKSKEGPRLYLTSKNIKDGSIDLSNVSYIAEDEHTEIYSKCPVKFHDVLLTKDGANTGNCALNNLEFEFSLLSSVAVLQGNPDKLRQEFLFQTILSDSVQSLISESMSGQAITRITLAKISGFTIAITSLAEQQRIATCLSSLDALITAETQKLEALKTHKRGLMQQLFPSPIEVEA